MTWVPMVLSILRLALLLLEGLANPQRVQMQINGTTKIPARIKRLRGQAVEIKATYKGDGEPIHSAVILIKGIPVYRAVIKHRMMLGKDQEIELGGTFE